MRRSTRPGRLLGPSVLLVAGLDGCASDRPVGDQPPAAATVPAPTATRSLSGTPVVVSSHCGVRSVWVDGELWLASPPLGGHNPPSGWDENQTDGVFVLTAPGRGAFHGDGGQKASFRLAESGTADPNAGCE